MTDPLPPLRKRQGAAGILVMPEGAAHGYESITQETVTDVAGLLARRRGHRVTLHAVRQRHGLAGVARTREPVAAFPVLVQHVAVAQVGDAGTADLSQPGEWGGIGGRAQNHVDPVAAAFQRRAVVRRAEENEFAKLSQPIVACGHTVMAGAPGYQPAHAVGDDHQFLDPMRPLLEKNLEQAGKRAPVGGRVKTAVVVEIKRGVAKVSGEGRTVVVPVTVPLQIIHAQAVCQYGQLAAPRRDRCSQRPPLERERSAIAPQAHGYRQRVVARVEVITQHAVQRGQHGLAFGR